MTRMTVKSRRFCGYRLWFWACPLCDLVSRGDASAWLAHTEARDHSRTCIWRHWHV